MPRLFELRPEVPLLLYYWQYFDLDCLRPCFPDLFRTARTAQDYVQRWRRAGYVKSARPGYQHQQHLHSLTPKAVEYLADHYGHDFAATADATVSPMLIEHERAVSHAQTDVYTAIRDRPDLSVPVWQRRFGIDQASTLVYLGSRGERLLKPDLAFLVVRKTPDGGRRPLMHFVEIDRGHEDMSVVRRKLSRYQRWYDYEGRDSLRRWYHPYGVRQTSFRLLVVTRHREPAGDHFRQLARWYTQALLLRPHLPLFITTMSELEAQRRGGSGRIWYPLYRFQPKWLRHIEAEQRISRAYDYVAEKLDSLVPRYALLPPAGNDRVI